MYSASREVLVVVGSGADDGDGSGGGGLCSQLPVYHGWHKEKAERQEGGMLQTPSTLHLSGPHHLSTGHCALVSMLSEYLYTCTHTHTHTCTHTHTHSHSHTRDTHTCTHHVHTHTCTHTHTHAHSDTHTYSIH